MAVIDQYTSRVLATGQIDSRATPNDFGADVGQGLEQVGQGLESVNQGLYKVEQDQGRIWAYSASGKAYTQLQQDFEKQKNALDPSAPDFTAKVGALGQTFQDQFDKTAQDLQDQAPSRSAARIVASHMAENRVHLMHTTMIDQSKMLGEKTLYDASDALKTDQDSIAADPSNENYDRLLSARKQSLGSLQTITPELKMKAMEQAEHGLAVTQVGVLASSKPDAFLAAVHAQGGRTTTRGAVRGAVPGGPADGSGAVATPVTQGSTQTSDTPEVADGLWSAQIGQESGGRQFTNGVPTTSSKGAVGVAQVMPGTGPEAAKLAGLPWDPRRFYQDASYNEALGKAYMAKQLSTFGGDTAKALAAYNMGPGSVSSGNGVAGLVAKYGDAWLSHAPAETQNYVASIMAKSSQNPGGAGVARPANAGAAPDLPQVAPLTDQDIAGAAPAVAGWGKLTWSEKVAAVRSAEGVVGGRLAADRGSMDRDLQDAQATLLAGKSMPGIDDPKYGAENLTRLYGPVDGPRKADQLQYVKQVGGFIGQMATMPVDQAAATLRSLEPQGGAEFANKNPVYKAAAEAYQRLDGMRQKDFMGWATENNVANVQPLDTSDPTKFQNSLHARIAVAQAGVNDYHASPNLLTADEASQLGDVLNRMNPQAQMSYLKAMKDGTAGQGDWFRNVLAQIAPKNTTLAYAAGAASRAGIVQTAGGQQDGNTVGQYILEGAHILQGKDLEDPTHTGRPLNLDDKQYRTMFWQTVGPDAFKSLDASRANQVASDTYQAVKNYLAADIYHRGLKPDMITSDMVKNAVTAVTGGTTKAGNGDNLFMPWGTPEDKFKSQFLPRAQDAINRAGLAGTALDKLDAYHFTNLDDGKYGMVNGNKMLTDINGNTVVIDFSKAYGAGADHRMSR